MYSRWILHSLSILTLKNMLHMSVTVLSPYWRDTMGVVADVMVHGRKTDITQTVASVDSYKLVCILSLFIRPQPISGF